MAGQVFTLGFTMAKITTSNTGGRKEMVEMLKFCAEKGIGASPGSHEPSPPVPLGAFCAWARASGLLRHAQAARASQAARRGGPVGAPCPAARSRRPRLCPAGANVITRPMDDVNECLEELETGKAAARYVLTNPPPPEPSPEA